ncbi:hypothetical protein AV641_08250 [Pseudomonas fragi]|nr:hypothetical protein AV641_08250 [Pseudomonas fragi]
MVNTPHARLTWPGRYANDCLRISYITDYRRTCTHNHMRTDLCGLSDTGADTDPAHAANLDSASKSGARTDMYSITKYAVVINTASRIKNRT